jgi:SPP1 family predicted phage head-tail adaptor
MSSGEMRQRISIQKKVVGRDSFGAEAITWSQLAEVWATAEPLRGQEYLEARRLQSDLDIRFRIRFREGIVPSMRVVYNGRTFDIVSAIHVKEMRREIQLMCKELIKES